MFYVGLASGETIVIHAKITVTVSGKEKLLKSFEAVLTLKTMENNNHKLGLCLKDRLHFMQCFVRQF